MGWWGMNGCGGASQHIVIRTLKHTPNTVHSTSTQYTAHSTQYTAHSIQHTAYTRIHAHSTQHIRRIHAHGTHLSDAWPRVLARALLAAPGLPEYRCQRTVVLAPIRRKVGSQVLVLCKGVWWVYID